MHGLLLAGRWASEVAAGLGKALEDQLAKRHASARWKLKVRSHRLAPLPREASEDIEAVRLRMLEESWDLAELVTDLPLAEGGRPVVGEVIRPTHRVAVISLPAIGPRRVRQRLLDAVIGIVGELIGEQRNERDVVAAGRRLARRRRRTRLRLAQIAAEPRDSARLFAVRVGVDHARLLWSMVWVNRPWRLVAGLYRALIAAVAFIVLTVVTETAWKLATELGVLRLAFLNGLSVTAMTKAIIAVHRLWERPLNQASRRQVALFNWFPPRAETRPPSCGAVDSAEFRESRSVAPGPGWDAVRAPFESLSKGTRTRWQLWRFVSERWVADATVRAAARKWGSTGPRARPSSCRGSGRRRSRREAPPRRAAEDPRPSA